MTEAGELTLMAQLHEERCASWQRLSLLADNAEVAKVCLDHAHVHAQHRGRILRDRDSLIASFVEPAHG